MLLLPSALAADDAFLRLHDLAVHAQNDGAPGCLLGAVEAARQRWGDLTAAQQAELSDLLAPGLPSLFPALDASAPPPPASGDACVGQQMAYRLPGEHFVVEWDDNSGDEETATAFLEALEYAYDVEVGKLGWREPVGDGRYLMPAYMLRGNAAGAYTTVTRCGNGYYPYIAAYAGSFAGGNWYETMALHEFNHSLQFSYSFAPEFYWWEATATYIEEQVLPGSNWWSTYVVGYSDNPHLAMAASSQNDYDIFYHMYGMSIFGFYLDEYQGGPDIVRQTWEAAVGENGQYSLRMDEMLAEVGVDWAAAYAGFTATNAAMDYREHRYFSPVDEVDEVSELPAEGASGRNNAPEGYGQNYARFQAGAGDGESTLVVHFAGDKDVEWLVQLVEVTNNAVSRVVSVETTGGATDVSLETFGELDAVLVVSPLKHNDTAYDYAWTAELVAPPEEDTAPTENGGESGGETSGEDPTGEPEKFALAGCGCASAPAPGAALGLLAVLLLRRRR